MVFLIIRANIALRKNEKDENTGIVRVKRLLFRDAKTRP